MHMSDTARPCSFASAQHHPSIFPPFRFPVGRGLARSPFPLLRLCLIPVRLPRRGPRRGPCGNGWMLMHQPNSSPPLRKIHADGRERSVPFPDDNQIRVVPFDILPRGDKPLDHRIPSLPIPMPSRRVHENSVIILQNPLHSDWQSLRLFGKRLEGLRTDIFYDIKSTRSDDGEENFEEVVLGLGLVGSVLDDEVHRVWEKPDGGRVRLVKKVYLCVHNNTGEVGQVFNHEWHRLWFDRVNFRVGEKPSPSLHRLPVRHPDLRHIPHLVTYRVQYHFVKVCVPVVVLRLVTTILIHEVLYQSPCTLHLLVT
eukprot:Hpha_TRINITY_DN26718_c0_g1::TRINITY_DN26718_c0_g1_i1::g.138911::m.138911